MAKLIWTRDGDTWSAKCDERGDRIARIKENWLGPRRRSYSVTIGLNEYGDATSLKEAKALGQNAADRQIAPAQPTIRREPAACGAA